MNKIHVYRATGQCYQPRARLPGHRKYELLGEPSKSLAVAMRRLASAMSSKDYKRGDVLLCADHHDPLPLYEMVRQRKYVLSERAAVSRLNLCLLNQILVLT